MEIHPAYHDCLIDSNYEDPADSGYYYKDYTWMVRKSTNGDRYNPPTNPSFYDSTSHDRASNEDLADTAQLIETVLEEWREWDTVDNLELIEGQRLRHEQLV